MEIRAPVETPDLEIVPALVVVLADMQQHVEVLDEVHQESERLATLLDRP